MSTGESENNPDNFKQESLRKFQKGVAPSRAFQDLKVKMNSKFITSYNLLLPFNLS